jgi:thiamine biosynthesis lipoprotein
MASQYTFEAIGTHWQIDIDQDISALQYEQLNTAIQTRIAEFDKNYSRFRDDSLVTKMSQQSGTFVVPEDMKVMMDLYTNLYEVTDRLVTPLMGQVLSDAGYDAQYSLQQKNTLQKPPALPEVLTYNHPQFTITQPVLFDFGALGKGYLIDIIADILEQHGIQEYCVDAGGDIIQRGTTALQVGLEDPSDTTKVIGVVELHNKSLCGSAGNRRNWANMHHIINPETLESVKNILAVWVVADTTILADGLTTCLFFVPPQTLTRLYSFEYLIIKDDYSIEQSVHFPAEVFTV